MRVAIIEVGSRAIRLLVADIREDGSLSSLATRSQQIPLGQVINEADIDAEAVILEVLSLVEEFQQLASEYSPRKSFCYGTAALRALAARSDRFRTMLAGRISVLTPEAEAECGVQAANEFLVKGPISSSSFLTCDQGGASIELASASAGHPLAHLNWFRSLEFGTTQAKNDFLSVGSSIEKFKLHTGSIFAELPKSRGLATVVALGSVATKIGWIKSRGSPSDIYKASKVHGCRLSIGELSNLISAFSKMAAKNVSKVNQFIDPREDSGDTYEVIVSGAITLQSIMEVVGASSIVVSTAGTRHGLARKIAFGR